MQRVNDNDVPLPAPGEALEYYRYLSELAEDLRENPDATISPEYGPDN